ncbi:hypothetical protein [Burkholderia ambifaria]|uniref:hypothetical protein n=1 Tax=Burkholderia ambifaria TaxID=152480 RepID=UPI001B92FB32|nr:hypothetical protein [Burkholderia ambifaria]MBR8179682.1 hypothetical protein [Burkholderia ambifaria]
MQAFVRWFSVAILATTIFTGCKGFDVKPADPPPCQTAMACVTEEVAKEPTCTYRKYGADGTGYRYKNSHPSKIVILSYEETVRHMNSSPPLPDEVNPHIAKIDPLGGVENPVGVGCWRTPGVQGGAEQFDEWSYSKITACFLDECNKNPPAVNKPVQVRDPQVKCEALCSKDDRSCLKAEIPSEPLADIFAKELDNVTFKFIRARGGEKIDMRNFAKVVNQFVGTDVCWRADVVVGIPLGGNFPFSNAGSSCKVHFSLTGQPNYASFGLELPGQWVASLIKRGGAYELTNRDESHSPLLSVVRLGGAPEEFDPIIKITGARGQMTFTGSKYYCGQLNWRARGD